MAQNIELKQKIDNFDQVLSKFKENEIEFIEVIPQRDIYYVNANGLLKLRVLKDRGELIFYQRDEKLKDRVSNYEILQVEPKSTEKFFSHIFTIETEVVKKRTLYMYKNTRIHLDEVEKLGTYLELETVVKEDVEEGKREFAEVVKILNLNLDEQIKSSYRTLLLQK